MREFLVIAGLFVAGLIGAEYLALAIAGSSFVIAVWSHIRLGRRITELAATTADQAVLSREMREKARQVRPDR